MYKILHVSLLILAVFVAPLQAFALDIPKILSPQDVQTYKEIFKQQRALNRSKVNTLAEDIEDPILYGHALAVRLLHPQTKATYADLTKFLKHFADHPQAEEIYKLAVRRKPKGEVSPPTPKTPEGTIYRYNDPDAKVWVQKPKHLKGRNIVLRIRNLRQTDAPAAARLLLQPNMAQSMGVSQWVGEGINVARRLLNQNELQGAYALSVALAGEESVLQTEALWLAGLSAYQAGQKDEALQNWRRLVYLAPENSRARARAAWWSARLSIELGQTEQADVLLQIAGQRPNTFYGQLAMQKRPDVAHISWKLPDPSADDLTEALSYPAIKRAIALAQVGEFTLAQEELRTIYPQLPRGMDATLVSLSNSLHMPQMALITALNLRDDNNPAYAGLYPVPTQWLPYGQLRIDPALLFALMRQESLFNPSLTSRAGARGLMQIMPQTAEHIRQKDGYDPLPSYRLLEPRTNVTLAQAYVIDLQNQFEEIPALLAAYNAGPSNVRKWLAEAPMQDPVLWLETLPFSETRTYVKNVLANYWMYQQRLGKTPTSRIAMVRRSWNNQFAQNYKTGDAG